MKNPIDMDIKRKRFLFSICTLIVVVLFPVLIVINYLQGDNLELIIDVVLIVIMVSSRIALKNNKYDIMVYRANHFMLGMTVFYCVLLGLGDESILYWTFCMPLICLFFLGKWEGLIWSASFSFILFLIIFIPSPFRSHIDAYSPDYRFFISLSTITLIAFGLESARYNFSNLLVERNHALLQEKEHLRQALKDVKTLRGLIPICSSCKNIRNDSGYWEKVETYIKDHSDAHFSHGICPDCAEKLYPEYKDLLKKHDKQEGN